MGFGTGCSELPLLKRAGGFESFTKKRHEIPKHNYKWALVRITDKGKSRPVLSTSFIPSWLLPWKHSIMWTLTRVHSVMTHKTTTGIFSAMKISTLTHTTTYSVVCTSHYGCFSSISWCVASSVTCYFHFYLYLFTFFFQGLCMIKTFLGILYILYVYRKMLLLVFSLDMKKSLLLTELFHGCQKCKLLITGNSGTGTGNFGVRINLVTLNVIRVTIVWIFWAYMKLQLVLAVAYSASW